MAIYSAYLPPMDSPQSETDAFWLVSDSKAPLALIFPPFWLAWHRLWLELLAYAVVAIAIAMLAVWKPATPILYLSALPGLYLLLEGNELIRRRLERLGWRFAGVVDGETLENAEIRFLAQHEDQFRTIAGKPEPNRQNVSLTSSRPAPAGLFPE